jgi:hypothetical protein
MSKYLLFIFSLCTIISCRKDDTAAPPPIDHSYYLTQKTQNFQGKLDGNAFHWSFGWRAFQGIKGYENGNGICDSTDPVRVVLFGLTSEDGGHIRFRLYSPKYNSLLPSEFSNVFSLGKKKLGDFRSDFYLSIFQAENFYESTGKSAVSEIEVLKTEEFTDYIGKQLRVWFKIHAFLSSGNKTVLLDGFMMAEFFGYKKE